MSGNSARIARIVDRFGGQSPLARDLACSQGTVWGWIKTGLVPSNRIPQIVRAGRRRNPPILLEPNDFFDAETVDTQTGSVPSVGSQPREAA